MIKASELRIGNWIEIRNEGRKPYYYPVSGHDIATIEDYGEGFEGGNYPIPITPEILENTGFYETELDGEYIRNKRGVLKVRFNEIGLISFVIGNIVFSTVHYLHQLQNLYFALTGEELTINLYP